jgi:hypothetical protein
LNDAHSEKNEIKIKTNSPRNNDANGEVSFSLSCNPTELKMQKKNKISKNKKKKKKKKSWSDDPCTIPTRPKYILLEPQRERERKAQAK